MDWLAVLISIEGQIAKRGEAFIPWSTVENASKSFHEKPEAAALARALGEDSSAMDMLKRLAEKVGNLELAVDRAGDMVYLKKPEQ